MGSARAIHDFVSTFTMNEDNTKILIERIKAYFGALSGEDKRVIKLYYVSWFRNSYEMNQINENLLAIRCSWLFPEEQQITALEVRDARIAQLTVENASLKTKLQQSNSQVATQEVRVSQLTTENANLRSSLQQTSQQASVKSASDSARISQLLAEAATMKAKLQQVEVEAQRLRSSEQKKTEESNSLQKQLEESIAKLASRDLVIANLESEIEKFKNELSQSKEKTNSKMLDVNTKIGLFKQIIATSASVDISHQQASNTQIAYQSN